MLGLSGAIQLKLLLSEAHYHRQYIRVRAIRVNFNAQTRKKLLVPDIEFKIDTTIEATADRNRATLAMETCRAVGV